MVFNTLHDEICIVFSRIPFVYKLPRNELTLATLGPNLILYRLEQYFRCLMKIIHLQMLICGRLREDRSPLLQIPYLLQSSPRHCSVLL